LKEQLAAKEREIIRLQDLISNTIDLPKNDCRHNNTVFQKINCSVCTDCSEIVETDI
jgi:hypothetical protein